MAQFRTRQRDELLLDMIASVVARSDLSDLTDGAVGKQILAATAREIEDVYDQLALLIQLFNPDHAQGEDLDELAAVFVSLGLPGRRAPVYATGAVTLTRNAGVLETVVPLWFGVAAPGGAGSTDVHFETTAEATIPAGAAPQSVAVAVRCKVPGAIGNVGSGAIIKKIGAVAGVDAVANPVAFATGEDEETDAQFRARIWEHLWSLPRNTPWALEYLAKGIGVATHEDNVQGEALRTFIDAATPVRRCRFARAHEDPAFPGVTDLYIDDGTGFAGVGAGQLFGAATNENVLGGALAATGGERRLWAAKWPINVMDVFLLEIQALGAGPWVAQVEGADYRLNRSNGLIVLTVGLTATDRVRATYSFHCDLARAVQYAVEGDPADREKWPGWRPSGGIVFVRLPGRRTINFTADITVGSGFDEAAKATECQTAVQQYIEALGIGENFIIAEAIERIMGVAGLVDVSVSAPVANIPVLPSEKPSVGVITIS